MRLGLRPGLLVFTASLICTSLHAQALRPVLVELFTSEGCSSCPPADELLRRSADRRVDGGQLMVVLSEHVTYWNGLGWADPYSQDKFTARQNQYGARFHLDSVYTPQIVVNGNRELLGSDERSLLRAVQGQPATADMLRIGSIERHGDEAVVHYAAAGRVPAGTELFAVVADDMDSSQVPRGENAGRRLTHVAVARSLVRVGALKAGDEVANVVLPHGNGGAQHIVLFAQGSGQGEVVSVAEAKLPEPTNARAVQAMGR